MRTAQDGELGGDSKVPNQGRFNMNVEAKATSAMWDVTTMSGGEPVCLSVCGDYLRMGC